jgi:16S rRNA (guanine966-N2)-methyltransferase
VRVVAGSARGRQLEAPPGLDTRPTSDRVREATFNALWSMGAVDGARVVDLFAGSGALGIEALSRGARQCTFVERSRAAVAVVKTNLAATGLDACATVVPMDALAWCRSTTERFDLVLADPPYAFADWDALLALVRADLVVAESNRAVVAPPGWKTARERRYGTTVTTFLARSTAAPPGPPEGDE